MQLNLSLLKFRSAELRSRATRCAILAAAATSLTILGGCVVAPYDAYDIGDPVVVPAYGNSYYGSSPYYTYPYWQPSVSMGIFSSTGRYRDRGRRDRDGRRHGADRGWTGNHDHRRRPPRTGESRPPRNPPAAPPARRQRGQFDTGDRNVPSIRGPQGSHVPFEPGGVLRGVRGSR